jgi:hypothetical protein
MWYQLCLDLTHATLLPRVDSWILGANIPGKPLTLNFYMGGYSKYKDIVQDIRAREYEPFSFHG